MKLVGRASLRLVALAALAACSSSHDDDGCAPPDAGIPPGQQCPCVSGCVASVGCEYVAPLDLFYCTRPCCTSADCAGVGFEACCMPPSFAQARALCMPVETGVCEGIVPTANFCADDGGGGRDGGGDASRPSDSGTGDGAAADARGADARVAHARDGG